MVHDKDVKKLHIYLLSRNRPEFVLGAIKSITTQDYDSFSLTISENSSDDTVQNLLMSEFPEIKLIRRKPDMASLDHFNTILSEIDSDFFMLFHDDDYLRPGALSEMMNEFSDDTIAVCGNADILCSGKFVGKVNFDLDNDLVISSTEEFIPRYTVSSANPFPGYIYRREASKKVLNGAGKYSDVSFLMDILSIGKIKWLSKSTMVYRIHANNDSVILDRDALFKLCEKMESMSPSMKKNIWNYYDFALLKDNFKQRKWIEVLKSVILFLFEPRYITRKIIRKIFLKRV